MYFVYIIRSIANSEKTYIGYTTDIEKRIKKHNSSKDMYTSKYKPWKLEYYSAFNTKIGALEFEKYLKSHSGKAFANKRLLGK